MKCHARLLLLLSSAFLMKAGFAHAATESFTFGEARESKAVETSQESAVKFGGVLGIQGAVLPDGGARPDVTSHVRFLPHLEWKLNENWDAKAAAIIHHYTETGVDDFSDTEIRYDENYIRYSKDKLKITLGAQKVIWGSVDGIKPTDQLGSQDLTRFTEDDYEDRRNAMPALRAEYYHGDYKLDGMVIAQGRETGMANEDSIWSFVDRRKGRILGVKSNSVIEAVVQNSSLTDDNDEMHGGGVRLSKTGKKMDWAVTAQRVKRSTPFYGVNPALIGEILTGVPVPVALANHADEDLLEAIHPWNTVIGGDIAIPVGSAMLRAEGAWMSDVPVYTSQFLTDKRDAFQLVAGAEFYPGNSDFRVIAQITAYVIPDGDNMAERSEIYAFNGSLENEFDHGRWVAGLDYSVNLDKYDVYFNPQVTYKGWDRHEIYVGADYFDGSQETMGGYFADNSQIYAGWNYKF